MAGHDQNLDGFRQRKELDEATGLKAAQIETGVDYRERRTFNVSRSARKSGKEKTHKRLVFKGISRYGVRRSSSTINLPESSCELSDATTMQTTRTIWATRGNVLRVEEQRVDTD